MVARETCQLTPGGWVRSFAPTSVNAVGRVLQRTRLGWYAIDFGNTINLVYDFWLYPVVPTEEELAQWLLMTLAR